MESAPLCIHQRRAYQPYCLLMSIGAWRGRHATKILIVAQLAKWTQRIMGGVQQSLQLGRSTVWEVAARGKDLRLGSHVERRQQQMEEGEREGKAKLGKEKEN